MKKIIHLSDLHFGWKKKLNNSFRAIIDNIIFEKQPPSNYVVLITGDLVDNANDDKYLKVDYQLKNLSDKDFDVLVVPGNHDYGNGVSGKKKFVKKFKKVFFNNPDIQYPKVDIVYDPTLPDNPNEAIAFIGLDSMAEELGLLDHLWAEGELGDEQIKRLDKILANVETRKLGKRVIYLHHHPFDPHMGHQLKDSKKLEEVLSDHINRGTTIDALLYGHNHKGRSHHGKWNIPRCYDGSSSTGKKKSINDLIIQRVINLQRDPRWDYNGNFHH